MSRTPLDQDALEQLFLDAHTHNAWQDKQVPDELLRRLYNTFRMGPTSANSCPARIVFVKSREAKEMLDPALQEGNRAWFPCSRIWQIVCWPDSASRKYGHYSKRSRAAR